MKVSVIGTGYVGLVTGTCFAELGHHVTCIDIDEKKIQILRDGKCPIYEPGLQELIDRNVKARRLAFANDYSSVASSKTVFLAVGTPSQENGDADLSYLREAAITVAKTLDENGIVVIKSTVPVGTSKEIKELIGKHTRSKFHLVSNPEFLKEGTAVEDFMRPDRVIIGHADPEAALVMEELYAPLVRQGNPIFKMSNLSAEVAKYAANCFLATKISFINEIAKFCDLSGADIEEVRRGIMSDKRIGSHFLYPGPGYGGSCFPKDVKALVSTAQKLGMNLSIVEAVEKVNKQQKTYMFAKIMKHFKNDLKGKTFGIWGVAFKPNTDDIREAPAIETVLSLLRAGAQIRIYDPVASENFMALISQYSEAKGKVKACIDKYEVLDHASGVVVMTEWREFKVPDFELLKANMKERVIFDARNIYIPQEVEAQGFTYYAIGRQWK
ncbi:MAG: UDP-glucose 6-dehydrogenase [Bdellovibrionales bacterium GWA2_49_15]|nr:MAG: UDP-glucose 6-dehydrogenase [Bdellovibrionales bacterium GWA2_49_15]HAZ11914.1 UDP-glucose 6-dehydrogenase [Bdellovibrionales bacterium]